MADAKNIMELLYILLILLILLKTNHLLYSKGIIIMLVMKDGMVLYKFIYQIMKEY